MLLGYLPLELGATSTIQVTSLVNCVFLLCLEHQTGNPESLACHNSTQCMKFLD